jgi:catechol 2,3-dioxygenase-like lactoylglutathione lyase family enzyme
MTVKHVANVAVPVTDQDRALDFYVGTLGFEKRRDAELQPGFRWIEVGPPGASTNLALAPVQPGAPAGVDTGIRLAVADAEATHRVLSGAGAAVGEMLRWDGVPPMFSFEDPDGNTLYVFEDE